MECEGYDDSQLTEFGFKVSGKGRAKKKGVKIDENLLNAPGGMHQHRYRLTMHPQLKEIEKDLMDRFLSIRQISEKWGFDNKTLEAYYRRKIIALGEKPAPVPKEKILEGQKKFNRLKARDEMEWLICKVKGVVEKVEKKELYGNVAKMLEIGHEAIRSLAEIDKEIGPGSIAQVSPNQHLHLVKVIQTPKLSDPVRAEPLTTSDGYCPPRIIQSAVEAESDPRDSWKWDKDKSQWKELPQAKVVEGDESEI